MKQAIILANKINNLKVAIYKTNSPKLVKDFSKALCKNMIELREYCNYKNINYNEILKIKGDK